MIHSHLVRLTLFVLAITFLSFEGFTQAITGEVKAKGTQELLPFVSIAIGETGLGVTTDFDGKYELKLDPAYQGPILVRNVGFKMQVILADDLRQNPIIELEEDVQQLSEVVFVAGENPANDIVRQAIKSRKLHDPERIQKYKFKSYAKEIYRLDPSERLSDSVIVALQAGGEMTKEDSLAIKSEKTLRDRHIFVSESVSEVKFMQPGMENETVLATNVSGFNSGLLAATGSSYQPLGFYKPIIGMLGTQYVNPINPAGLSQYDFYIEDTLYLQTKDTVWVLSFEPKRGKKIDAFKGLISISDVDHGITHVIAEGADSKSTVGLHIEQRYEKLEEGWFPVMQYTNFILDDFKFHGHSVMLENYRYLSEIELNPDLSTRDFGDVSLSIQKQNAKQSIQLIESKRPTALDRRELRTFSRMDSISGKLQILETVVESLFTQRYEVGKVDVRLNDILAYNDYEKFRLGLGLETNDNLLKWFKVGSYAAYGTGDEAWKYGANMKFEFDRRNSTYLLLNYRNDLKEVGSINFFEKSYGSLSDLLRSFQGNLFDTEEHYKATFNTRLAPFVYAQINAKASTLEPNYQYTYSNSDFTATTYDLNEVSLAVRFARNERYLDLYGRRVATGVDYPVVKARYAYSNPSMLGGDFDYSRVDVSVNYEKKYRFGKTDIMLQGNYISGDSPYSYLVTGSGNSDSFLSVWGFFQTMGRYEFLSDRYASLFLRHNFGNILIDTKFVKPELLVFYTVGVGELVNGESHQGIGFNTLEKGYFESGIGLKNLLRISIVNLAYITFGVEGHYRHGEYANSREMDNLFVKMNVSYSL